MTGPATDALAELLAPKNYQALYSQIGRLLATMPAVVDRTSYRNADWQQWLGRAVALTREVGGIAAEADARLVSNTMDLLPTLTDAQSRFRLVTNALYRALGECEVHLPATASGAFLPVGAPFDAYAAISKVFEQAREEIFIVDPYMDEAVLVEFGQAVPAAVLLRLLADERDVKPSLAVAATRWQAQHGGARPLAVRLAPPRALHDRAIFVDGASAWSLTQSLKDFAKRSPAEIYRSDDTAVMKIAAYEGVWTTASVVV